MKFPKNIYLLSAIAFFSSFYLYLPILTPYLQSKGLGLFEVASLSSILIGTIFFAEVPTGIIADKLGRKNSILIALLFQVIGEVVFLLGGSYSLFVLSSVIAGIGFAFQSGSLDALLYDSLKEFGAESQMKRAAGLKASWFQLGHISGAILSSLVVTRLITTQMNVAIVLTIINVTLALLISVFLKEPKLPYVSKEQNPLTILNESFKHLLASKKLQRVVLFGLFTTPFVGMLRTLHAPYFEVASINPQLLGLTLGVGGVLAVLASKYAYVLESKLGVKHASMTAAVLPAVFYLLMVVPGLMSLAPILFILNFGLIHLQDPLLVAYYNIHIPSQIRATTLSGINMLSSLYIALMGLMIGWLADISLTGSFLLIALLIAGGVFFFKLDESHVAGLN